MMQGERRTIAVVGAGISGMSAAWLLSQAHDVSVYEAAPRPGGHSFTVETPGGVAVDMGFIVYNEQNYPNLTALFDHLGVVTKPSDMSFGVSLDDGALEYSGDALFAQRRNIVSPRFWGMLRDLARFYRTASNHSGEEDGSLAEYLAAGRYGRAFCEHHLLPQAAAIWSASVEQIGQYPAAAFIRFFQNHGLLKLNPADRPTWRTVEGGSRAYVRALTARYTEGLRSGCPVRSVRRGPDGVWVRDAQGEVRRFDDVVLACHADQALALIEDPSADERALLGAIRYTANLAVLHSDEALMPRRRAVWSSWNYLGTRDGSSRLTLCVSYWMNRLQSLQTGQPLFVTLNPMVEVDPARLIRAETFEHPLFDAAALAAQPRLWSLQGVRGTWFAGAYFGSGFHEDGLQAGLAVAEAIGGVKRPWTTPNPNGRIPAPAPLLEAAE